jgi:hypothetical protein
MVRTNVSAFKRSAVAAWPEALPSVWAVYRRQLIKLSTAFFKKLSPASDFFPSLRTSRVLGVQTRPFFAGNYRYRHFFSAAVYIGFSALPHKNPEEQTTGTARAATVQLRR